MVFGESFWVPCVASHWTRWTTTAGHREGPALQGARRGHDHAQRGPRVGLAPAAGAYLALSHKVVWVVFTCCFGIPPQMAPIL